MESGKVLYDDHPTAAVITLSQNSGTNTFLINESDEQIENLASAVATARAACKAITKKYPEVKFLARLYDRDMKRRGILQKIIEGKETNNAGN